MKKLLIILVSVGLALGAYAQKGHGGGYRVVRPRVVVAMGYSPFYSPFYRPYYGPYSPWGYPYGYSNFSSRPSKLDLEIEDIRVDYADRIKSVKMDESLSRKEKKLRIKDLKYDRDKAVIDAKKNYYYKQRS